METTEDFSDFVRARWPRLVRSAILLGCSPQEAEDVVQTALMQCLIHWRKVSRANDRDAYVHRVLINSFTSSRRGKRNTEKIVATVPDQLVPDATAELDQSDAILRSLNRLPSDQRTAIVLRYYLQLSELQMCEILDVPTGTIKSRLSRAIKLLSQDFDLLELRGIQ